MGLPAQNCKDKTARAKQKGEDSQKKTGRTGQLATYSRTARAGQPDWNTQEHRLDSTGWTAQTGQDY
jgi:hypothetical protein